MKRHIAGLVRSLTWAATIAVGAAPSTATGQAVRGIVTDRGTGVRAAGAVVILEGTAADSSLHARSVLADASAPSKASFCPTSSVVNADRNAALSRSMIGRAVPAGARRP